MSKSAVVTIGILLCLFGAAMWVHEGLRYVGVVDGGSDTGPIVIGLVLTALGTLVVFLGLRRKSRPNLKSEAPQAENASVRKNQTRLAVGLIMFVWILFTGGLMLGAPLMQAPVAQWAYGSILAFVCLVVLVVCVTDPLKAEKYSRVNEIYLFFGLASVLAATSEPISSFGEVWLSQALGVTGFIQLLFLLYFARAYARSKGRSAAWGWVMLLNVIGIVILARLRARVQQADAEALARAAETT